MNIGNDKRWEIPRRLFEAMTKGRCLIKTDNIETAEIGNGIFAELKTEGNERSFTLFWKPDKRKRDLFKVRAKNFSGDDLEPKVTINIKQDTNLGADQTFVDLMEATWDNYKSLVHQT